MKSIRILRDTAIECLEAVWSLVENDKRAVKQVIVRGWGQIGIECEFIIKRRNAFSSFTRPLSYFTGVDCVGGYKGIEAKYGYLNYSQIKSYLASPAVTKVAGGN